MELREDQIIGNKYRVIKLLGKGGMGAVYEVEHLQLRVRRALKIFTVETDRQEMFRKRFEGEGKLLSKLDHPNLVKVYDLDFLDGGNAVYYVMDIIRYNDDEPRTLAAFPPGDFDETQVLTWFADMCSALDYIHERGIVHRDIKLNNILVNTDGHAVLADFGISRICNDRLRQEVDIERTIVTGSVSGEAGSCGMVWGTLGYIAPEVKAGKPADASADTYSLAVAFFKLLTNVWYDVSLAASNGTSSGKSQNAVKMLESMDYNWVDVLPKMLEENPRERPRKLSELVAVASIKRQVKRTRRWYTLIWLWVAVGVLLAAGAGVLVSRNNAVQEISPSPATEDSVEGGTAESVPIEEGLYVIPAAFGKK